MREETEIEKEIEKIHSDREKGASELLYDAVSILKKVSQTRNIEKVVEVSHLIEKLRPSMVIIKNHMIRIRKRLFECGLDALDEYPQILNEMRDRAIENANFLRGTVITCSFSSLVRDVLIRPSIRKVIALRSYINGISYGEKMKETVGEKVEVVDEKEIKAIPPCDYGLIGADAITENGFVINGYPSLFLAEMCKLSNIPLYIVATLDKFADEVPVEEGFEKVPVELIKGFITEEGVLTFEEFVKCAKSVLSLNA